MSNIAKSTISSLHLLSMDNKYLELLFFFYNKKDTLTLTRHSEIFKKFNYKSSSHISYHLKRMISHGLIEKRHSEITKEPLEYKITYTGIKFFQFYKKIEAEIF